MPTPKPQNLDEWFKAHKDDERPTSIKPAELDEVRYAQLEELLSLTKMKILVMKKFSFVSSVMFRLNFQWSYSINTACTDGKTISFNPDFFELLTVSERLFVICHEVWHVALRHMTRGRGKIGIVYNIAADYVINWLLDRDGIKMNGLKAHGCYNAKYANMSTEQIYFELIKDVKKHAPKAYVVLGGNSPMPPDVKPGDLSKGDAEALKNALGLPENAPLPEDIITIDPNDDDAAKELDGLVAGAYKDAQNNPRGCGSIPGELEMFIDQFLEPKLPWFRILAKYFNSLVEDEYSYTRPNRRYTAPNDPILKCRMGTVGLDKIFYFVDCSGSITDEEIIQFNSEAASIKKAYNPEEMRIIIFDTKIRNNYLITRNDKMKPIGVSARGGTCVKDVFEYINDNKPDVAVIFTDLIFPMPREKPKAPLIWIAKNNPNATVPFGRLIHFNE